MTALRRHIHRYRWLSAALIVAALLVRMLVPVGYMPGTADGAFVLRPCDGLRAMMGVATANAAMTSGDYAHAGHGDAKGDGGEHGKLQSPCAFSGLAIPSLAAIDPILLAIALAFILAAPFRIAPAPALWRIVWLRPPPQGPPVTA